VGDVFDALTHERPYKAAWPVEKAIAEMIMLSAEIFDPKILEAFPILNPSANDKSRMPGGMK